jgi:hypothetical protein
VFVLGSHLGCPAFQRLLHAAVRGIVDGLGASTFNVAALNVDQSAPHPRTGELAAAEAAAAAGGEGGAAAPRARPRVRVVPRNALWVPGSSGGGGGGGGGGGAARAPVVARVVSRGKLDSPASDFGGLEVFGGASIGHTDPYRVAAAVDDQLAALPGA